MYGNSRIFATMNIQALDQAAEAATDLLKALSSPIRLKILCQLLEGEKSVGQIAAMLHVRDTLISQHLALLRRDGLVRNRRDAQTIYYSLASMEAERLLHTLHELFCGAAESSCSEDRKA